MLSTERPEQAADDGVLAAAKPPCVALVPMVPSAQWSRVASPPPRPDSIFVTHLVATAEQGPQTRSLRRARRPGTPAAYRARPAPGARTSPVQNTSTGARPRTAGRRLLRPRPAA